MLQSATKRRTISAGVGHSGAVLDGGELMMWGLSRQQQLGVERLSDKERAKGKTEADLGPPRDRAWPELVASLKFSGDHVVTVACASTHTLAATRVGELFSWGQGAFGKLGHGDQEDVRIPKRVPLKRLRVRTIAAGADHCAIVSDRGEVLSWGSGAYGNLGHGDNLDLSSPKLVDALLGKHCIGAACGTKHTLAVTQTGDVYSFGHGGGGRLGHGSTRGEFRPKLIAALGADGGVGADGNGMAFVGAGESHSFAISTGTELGFSWGVGDFGKLGHGDSTPQLLPRQIESFRNEKLVWMAGGAFHSAAVTRLGVLYTWGSGAYGKLGQGDTMNSPTPRPVRGIGANAHFVQVECGTFHSIAVTKMGDVFSFGFSGNGRLGLSIPGGATLEAADGGTLRSRVTPQLVRRLEGLAVKDSSDIGMPKDESSAASASLLKALRPKSIETLALGGFHSAALSDSGDVYGWGDGRHGALGVELSAGDAELRLPARIQGLGGGINSVTVLSCGVRHSLALTAEGELFAWGDGALGQLGHGDASKAFLPRRVTSLKGYKVVHCAAGEEHSICCSSDGVLFAWGSGSFGKLGLGALHDAPTPKEVALGGKGRQAKQVACGFAHSLCLCDNFEVLSWGSGWKGKLGQGDDTNRMTPTPITGLKRQHCVALAAGAFHSLALTEGGDVLSWGVGDRGQLGHGDLHSRKTPTTVMALQGAEAGCIAAGETHSLAGARNGRRIWSWGGGSFGQLGLGARSTEQRLTPSAVEDLDEKGTTAIACGANHSAAICKGGAVYAWGNGANFRLGNNDAVEQPRPVRIEALDASALGAAGDDRNQEYARLLTPQMMRQLERTDVDAATAQRVLDDTGMLAQRARQADAQIERECEGKGRNLGRGLREELTDKEKDEASKITTVMAVAMAGRAVRPTVATLQQLVKNMRENVGESIASERAMIKEIKARLDAETKRNDALEDECLDAQEKVRLVLENHKMVQELLAKSVSYERVDLFPEPLQLAFNRPAYEALISLLYETPAYLAALFLCATAAEIDEMVPIVVNQLYANHFKARDEYCVLSLLLQLMSDECTKSKAAPQLLSAVTPCTKLLAAYTRRGPAIEALSHALLKPLALVLARKRLLLSFEPAQVYAEMLSELRNHAEADERTQLKDEIASAEAWAIPEVRKVVSQRVRNVVDITELFLTRIIAARSELPYGVRALAKRAYEIAQDRFPQASESARFTGVANLFWVSFICPAIISPAAYGLCSVSNSPTGTMRANLVAIATALHRVGACMPYDEVAEPWKAPLSALVSGSTELMRQFYSALTEVPELEEQRSLTVYLESCESLRPIRCFELNALFLLHALSYRDYEAVGDGVESGKELHKVLLQLGNMPEQVSEEHNRLVTLRLTLHRPDKANADDNSSRSGAEDNLQSELRAMLLDALRLAPTVAFKPEEKLRDALEALLQQSRAEGRYEAAAKTQQCLEAMRSSGLDADTPRFLQDVAHKIGQRARERVELVKERLDLQKIADFVTQHTHTLHRRRVAFLEYLQSVREHRITIKNVYTSERMQNADRDKLRNNLTGDAARRATRLTADVARKAEEEKVKTVMKDNPVFRRIVQEHPGLVKYLESHPNLTRTQMRDLLDRRPDFVSAFDKFPYELMHIGRAPALRLMIDCHPELKAALDRMIEVRELLESQPDLDKQRLREMVFSNAQLKDLYDSRPELKRLLTSRAELFEEEMRAVDACKPEEFVAGPLVHVAAKYLLQKGIAVSLALPAKMVKHLSFEFSSVRPGITHVLGTYKSQAALAFDLELEELLDMQYRRIMVKDLGKLKLDVNKVLAFLNEKMRF